MLKTKQLILFLIFLYSTLLIFIGYFIDRVEEKYFTPYSFWSFFSLISVLFILVFILHHLKFKNWTYKNMIVLCIGIRAILLFSEPNLSDDYYRYLWDGNLVTHDINPYLILPSEAVEEYKTVVDLEIYHKFNSQNYYSVYPPVCQFISSISITLGGSTEYATIILRVFVLMAEIGSLFFLGFLLKFYKKPVYYIMLYGLNPLILLELTVNLHFEAFLIFFMLGSLYFYCKSRYIFSGIFWGLAISTKILPIVYLIYLFRKTELKKAILISGVAILTLSISFLPFWNFQILSNIGDSLNKYFGYFEFNGGIPYLIREIGYLYVDYSILFKVMPIVKLIFLGSIVIIASILFFSNKFKASIEQSIFWTGFFYFLVASILHPWYITFLIPLGILIDRKFILIWSYIIFLSYSAYQYSSYEENYNMILIEFIVLILSLFISLSFTTKCKETFGLTTNRKIEL